LIPPSLVCPKISLTSSSTHTGNSTAILVVWGLVLAAVVVAFALSR